MRLSNKWNIVNRLNVHKHKGEIEMNIVKTVQVNVITFDQLPKEAKRNAKENISDVLNDMLDCHIKEIKASKDAYIDAYNKGNLYKLDKDNYALTGVCYDYDFMQIDHNNTNSVLDEVNKVFMKLKRDEKKNVFSDEYVSDFCEANEIYFLENGQELHTLERLLKGI